MSRPRRPPLQWRRQSSSHAARRERSLSRRAHLNLNLSRQPQHHPQHLWQVNRDHERRAGVAVAEVVAEVVRGRERLHPRPRSPQNLPQEKHPQ